MEGNVTSKKPGLNPPFTNFLIINKSFNLHRENNYICVYVCMYPYICMYVYVYVYICILHMCV